MDMPKTDETITKEDIVQYTINILTGITIPVMQSDTIGTAVKSAVNNLIVLQEMMQDEKAHRTEKASQQQGAAGLASDAACNASAATTTDCGALFPEDDGKELKEDNDGNAEI